MSAPLLYPYQRRWLMDPAKFKIGMFARQTGKTFTTTLEIVDDCFAHDLQKRRTRWVILSRGERQAREAMREGVSTHINAYQRAIGAVRDTSWSFTDPESRVQRTALEYTWPNGSIVTALPANPDTARGFSANVFLDEFAFHQDSREIWKALFPVVSKPEWKLRVTSTPNGKNNRFYDLMTGQRGQWSRHVVDIYQAIADGLDRDAQALRDNLDDEDAWAQEFELKWLDEASAWIDYELINSVEHDHAGDPAHYTGGPCFSGEDIASGRGRDLWVLTVFEQVGDVLWERERIEGNRISFEEQDAHRKRVFRQYHIVRHCMDQTGMGERVVAEARRAHGASRVEGVILSAPVKLNLATLAKQRFQDRKLRIRLGDNKLRADLHSLRKASGPTGTPRFVVDSADAAAAKSHADRAWSLFLALAAAATPRLPTRIDLLGTRSSSRALDDLTPLHDGTGAMPGARADLRGF